MSLFAQQKIIRLLNHTWHPVEVVEVVDANLRA
jgi:hypothetical protein